MASGYVIGVDGGGSKTLALVADRSGTVLGRGEAGPSNYQAVGGQAALAALEAAVQAGRQAAGVAGQPASAVCLGLAGVGRPEDRQLIQSWAEHHFSGAAIVIANDAQLALAAGTPDNWGVAVISGTGSLIYASDRKGSTARAGGWGYLLGDEGSGYAIGLRALCAVARAHDGRGPQTLLTGLVMGAWGLQEPPDLIRHVYGGQISRAEIGKLGSLVEQAALQMDAAAAEILAEAGEELALGVKSVVATLSLEGEVPCVLAGGALVKGRLLGEYFLLAAGRYGLRLQPIQKVAEPAVGAVRIACAL